MLKRSVLNNRVVESLLKKDFEVFVTRGCFDIAAKRDRLMLIKSLINVDGFKSNHAKSLRAISYFMSASPFVVSMRNNRSFLDDDMIYSRFKIPVVTPKTFEDILEEEAYAVRSAKGRHSIEIDADLLRERRNDMKFTLEELADLVGISKKALYEIENERTNPTEQTVRKLERMLNVELRVIYEPEKAKKASLEPENELQKKVSKELDRMGVQNSSLHYSPFDIIGKAEFSLIAGLSSDMRKKEKKAGTVKGLSRIFSSSACFVASKSDDKSVSGVPVLLEDDLAEIDSSKELKKVIEDSLD